MHLMLIAACTGSRGTLPELPDLEPTPEQRTCQADADCAAVELGCCNHCNGGRVVGVNRASAAAIEASRQAPCDDFACTRKMCRPAKVRCDQGSCRVR